MKKALTVLSFLFLVLLAIPVVQAQDTSLTQTFTAPDNSFSIMYPAGWTTTGQTGNVVLFMSRAGMNLTADDLFTGAPTFASGDAAVIFGPSTGMALNLHDSAHNTAAIFGKAQAEADVAVDALTVGSFPAARAVVAKAGSPYDVEVITVDFGSNQIGDIVGIAAPGELAALEPTMLAMVATATVGGSNSASATAAVTAVSTEAPAALTTTLSLQPKALWTDDVLGFATGGLAFSVDDKSLLVGSTVEGDPNTRDIALVDAATGKQLKNLSGLQRASGQVAISPDGTTIAGSDNSSLIVWDAASGAVKTTIQTQQYEVVGDLAYNPKTGALLYITQGNPNDTLWQLDLASGQPEALYVIDRNNPLAGLAISPDGSSALVGVKDESDVAHVHATVYQIDLTSHNATKIFDQPDVDQIALLYPAQGQPLIAVNPEGTYTTQVWDITGNKLLYTLPEAKTKEGDTVGTDRIAINPAGTILATGSISVEAQLWDAKTGAPLATLDRNLSQMQNSEPYGFAFSSDGNRLAVTYGNNKVVLWSLDGSGAPATSGGSTSPTAAAPTATTTASGTTTGASSCTVTAAKGANLRTGPGTTFDRAGALAAGASQAVVGQAKGSDGFVWWELDDGNWVRSDLVQTTGDCTSVTAAS